MVKAKTKTTARSKSKTKPKTIGDLHAEGKLPPNMVLPMSVQHINNIVEKAIKDGWKGAEEYLKGEGRSFIGDMLLPDGTPFGDAFPADLLPYADKTMDEIIASLSDPDEDEDEADFLEDGATPAPSDDDDDGADFISEEEDENPTGVIR